MLCGPRLSPARRSCATTAPGFRASNPPEGRTRVNDSTGYQITWRERRDGRTIYARDIWLVPPVPGARDALLVRAAHDARGRDAERRSRRAAPAR